MKNYKILEKIYPSNLENFLKFHQLEGYAFKAEQNIMDAELLKKLEMKYNLQKLMHTLYLEEKKNLQENYISKKIEFIKGGFLLDNIYSTVPGVRALRDLDIYCHDEEEYQKVISWCLGNNYNLISEEKWKGSKNKVNLKKKISKDISLQLEIHNRLYYRQKKPFHFNLSIEKHLLYIIIHYGYQHTFEKLCWLLDILIFVDMYKSSIDWDKLLFESRDLNMQRYLNVILGLIEKHFQISIPVNYMEVLGDVIRPDLVFFGDYKANYFKFLFYKMYLKNSVRENIDYNLNWLISSISFRERQDRD